MTRDSPHSLSLHSEGLKWQRAAAQGLGLEVGSPAVHRGDAKVVAMGADDGLTLSRALAESFERLVGKDQGRTGTQITKDGTGNG